MYAQWYLDLKRNLKAGVGTPGQRQLWQWTIEQKANLRALSDHLGVWYGTLFWLLRKTMCPNLSTRSLLEEKIWIPINSWGQRHSPLRGQRRRPEQSPLAGKRVGTSVVLSRASRDRYVTLRCDCGAIFDRHEGAIHRALKYAKKTRCDDCLRGRK